MNENQKNCEQSNIYGEKARLLPGLLARSEEFRENALLHGALVGLDHFLDHLAADGAGFAGGEVAVVAVLQVDANLRGCFHLELIHGLACFGNVDVVAVTVRHIGFLLLSVVENQLVISSIVV